ncbi:MAG: nucleoside phosphorylase [bacterium]|nr:nucleoside phosphorylase [bacterium]
MSSEYFVGRQYHIGVSPGDIAQNILLCGDLERAKKTAQRFDENSIRFQGSHREFVTFTGTFKKIPVTVMATGIGTDNTEIAVIEASQCVEYPTFIRIGSCGAIRNDVHVGDLVISYRALPRENTSSFYLPEGTIVNGTPKVVRALEDTARRLGYRAHVGTTCSTSSFYGGQGREVPGFPIRDEAKRDKLFPQLLALGVLNFEMETSALYTLAVISTRGIRAGSVCAVFAERQEGKGFDLDIMAEVERRCIDVGLEAIVSLAHK